MSDSTFNADLDALVNGEAIASGDELTLFVSDLYGKERNVRMPHALKLRIAGDLGLETTPTATIPAPVSRRTQRASEQQSRNNRPWAIALAVAAAVLIVFTAVLRWGLPIGNDESDNRFLLSSPAVPTVAATPPATLEAVADWLQPLSVEDCSSIVASDPPQITGEDFDAYPARQNIVSGPADPTDAFAANQTARQYMACGYPTSLASERYAGETSLAGNTFSPFNVVLLDQQSEASIELSSGVEAQGITPADTVIEFDQVAEGYYLPNPTLAFSLEDGRLMNVAAQRTGGAPLALGMGMLLIDEGGHWRIDGMVPLCIGECEDAWQQIETAYRDLLWLMPIAAQECEGNAYLPAALSSDQAAAIRSRQYLACEANGDASALQGPEYRVTEGEDALPLSEEIEALHRSNGHQAGSLQRIVNAQAMQMVELPDEPWAAFQPHSVVTLADGRVAVLESRVVSPDIVSGSGRTSPVVTTALVWIVDGDTWLLDEEVEVCIGNCDAHWDQGSEPVATPAATVAAIVLPETCEASAEFRADFISHDRMPIQLRPGPGNLTGFADIIMPNTPLQYLCEAEPTSSPNGDRMEEGQVWLHVITEDGSEGWIREVDVRPVD